MHVAAPAAQAHTDCARGRQLTRWQSETLQWGLTVKKTGCLTSGLNFFAGRSTRAGGKVKIKISLRRCAPARWF